MNRASTPQLLLLVLLLPLLTARRVNFIKKEVSFLGPFTIGKNELDGNPASDIDRLYQSHVKSGNDKTDLISELVEGGSVNWTRIQMTKNQIHISPASVNFNRLVQSLFSMEVQEVQGWVVGEISVIKSGTYTVSCLGIITCYVDDLERMMAGDIFRSHRVRTTVHLKQGKHLVYGWLKFVAKAQVAFDIQGPIQKVLGSNILIHPLNFVPDLLGLGVLADPDVATTPYYMGAGWLAIPVTNQDASDIHIRFQIKQSRKSKKYGLTVVHKHNMSNANHIVVVKSGQFTAIPVQIQMEQGIASKAECPLSFEMIPYVRRLDQDRNKTSVKWIKKKSLKLQMRCRTTRQSWIFSFVDHDGSVSRAAAISPLPSKLPLSNKSLSDSSTTAGVVLSLHGTGVDVSMQADSYKYKPFNKANDDKEPYIFGVEGMWTLAPTRNGAHNWEYTGFLSALQALQVLGAGGAVPRAIQQHLPLAMINYRNVIYAGHSMGGHGAWHIATHVPDRGLGVMSAAGWIRKEYYGDSNRFFIHDIGHSHIDSSLKGLLESTIVEYNSDLHVDNLKGLFSHARIGANDRAVPPFQVKKMVRLMREKGIQTEYEELKGKEHWWWDSKTTNDGGVLNDKKMRKLFRKINRMETTRRKRGGGEITASLCPVEEFTLVTMHPGSTESKCGLRVLQTHIPLRLSKVQAVVVVQKQNKESHHHHHHKVWSIKTQNIRRLAVDRKRLCGSRVNTCMVSMDGETPMVVAVGDYIHEFCRFRKKKDVTELNVLGEVARHEEEATIEEWEEWEKWEVCGTHAKQVSLVSTTSYSFEEFERGPTNSGPARQLFAAPFLIVTTSAELPKYLSLYIANVHMVAASTSVSILHDNVLTREQEHHNNLFVVGRHNKILKEQQRQRKENAGGKIGSPPVEILEKGGFRVGPCMFNQSGTGLIFTAPYWDSTHHRSRLRVFMLGTDDEGLRAAAQLIMPTIPPMYRAPLSNQMPDFIVVSRRVLAAGAGGILSAGMWNYNWKWSSESSYWQC